MINSKFFIMSCQLLTSGAANSPCFAVPEFAVEKHLTNY